MAVDTKHDDYILMEPEWQKCLDFADSETKVRSKKELYCPRPTGQDDQEYNSYMNRASLSMFFKKTLETYRGMATRVPAYVTDAEKVEDFLANVTGSGKDLTQYIYTLLGSFFKTGRCGTLLSLPQGLTNSDPMFLFYNEMSIINWREVVKDSQTVLSEVRLREVVEESRDEFVYEETTQIRVLDLDENGLYRVRVYGEDGSQIGKAIEPKIDNKRLDYIPFVFHGGVAVKSPFLIEIVDLNKHHFRQTCEYYNAMYRTSQGQYWLAGVDEKEIPTQVGGSIIWAFGDADATANLLEPAGDGLKDYSDSRKDIKETISALAVNLVLNGTGEQTATQANIDSSNQTAALAGIVNQISEDITRLLDWACEWMDKECGAVKINTDFISKQMTPEMIREVRQSWLDGAISYETMWANLQQGEIADQNKKAGDEQTLIESDMPAGMVGGEEQR
jgi:hypothetical protein